jgi:hypothetical protein
MHCAFINTERLDHRGRHVHKCANCGREVGSKYADPGMLTAICSEDPGKPGLIRRAMNFTRAAVGHARSGFRRVSDEAREERRAICSKCPLFDGSICTHLYLELQTLNSKGERLWALPISRAIPAP